MTTLAQHKYFESIAFAICLVYIISQAFDDAYTSLHIVHWIDYVTAILLIGETGLRLHSLRHVFLLNIWNFIDAIIVIFLIIGKLIVLTKFFEPFFFSLLDKFFCFFLKRITFASPTNCFRLIRIASASLSNRYCGL